MSGRTADPGLIRRFGAYRYRNAPEGRELVLDTDLTSLVNAAVGAALVLGSAAAAGFGALPWIPALVGALIGALVLITAIGVATDRSRTLFTGQSVAFGEPRAHPDLQWPCVEIEAIELHRPRLDPVSRIRRTRRRRAAWRIRLRNTRGERFPPVFRLASEADARELAAEIAAQTGVAIELVGDR